MKRMSRRVLGAALYALAAVALFFILGSRAYTDWLWFNSEGYPQAFWVGILSKACLAILVGTFYLLFLLLNLNLTKRSVKELEWTPSMLRLPEFFSARWLSLVFLALSAFIAFLAGAGASQYWTSAQQFIHAVPFGKNDPIFHKDVGFYIFKLPFLVEMYSLAMNLIVTTIVLVAIVYLVVGAISLERGRPRVHHLVRGHLAVLIGVAFFLKGWGYQLSAYNILYSPRGVVFGAGYTDVHANLMALRILGFIAVVCGILVVLYSVFRTERLALAGTGILIAASFILGNVYPPIVQKLSVEPNELARERPYIAFNIEATRRAFGLDRIVTRDFDVSDQLTPADLERHQDTISNIRLWDWRPLLETYSQLQEIRLYYDFHDVDLDRYNIGGRTRQVALAPRELRIDQIPEQARTWINQHLVYTHGYGLCMSPVSDVTEEGLPRLIVRDIPPRSMNGAPRVTRPEIYFGELTDQYVIVNTRTREFDYPMGDQNVYAAYQGKSGVGLGGLARRIAFALRFGNAKLLLTSAITADSKVLFYRNIKDRVRRVAPFLRYDGDPYLVIDDGRLFWIWDAYTTSSRYPYSQPHREGFNYIRNSIKVVIDAYDGTMTFYLFDADEPIAKSYSKIFPGMFRPFGDMPQGLRDHIRYPEDLFRIQAEMLGTYHMTDTDVFYNKEDLWEIPNEVYAGTEQKVQPYYIMMRPPGEAQPRYLVTIPFTPGRKNNMVAWLLATCDVDDYGRLVLYRFPKQRLVYGPMQIEARIDQDPQISQLLTLWSQKGSRVIRGNLLTVPIERSVLYIEPLYLLAEKSGLPELRMVIVALGSRIAMGETLGEALDRALGVKGPVAPPTPAAPAPRKGPQASEARQDLIQSAIDLYQELQARAREGDWAGFGENLKRLGDVLKELQDMK
ncbi:MAG TPA: UPF0182 family protein [Firmicutes bacterium]|nr:UPF0182 family protein [Bacillota bacterium]